MANAASVTISATVLPDNISKTIAGTQTCTPADASEKWYYKFTSCTASSTDLIAGYFIDYTGVDDDSAPVAVATGDHVRYLFVKNTDSTNDLYIKVDGDAASTSAAGSIKIPAGESVSLRPTNSTVADIHCISSSGNIDCIVAALLHDISV